MAASSVSLAETRSPCTVTMCCSIRATMKIHELLSKVMVDGTPDPARFKHAAGEAVAEAARRAGGHHRRVVGSGEGAPVLWANGEVDAAIQLEHLWDDVARSQPMDLQCAYPMTARDESAHSVNEQFRLIANTAPVMIWMSDVDKQVTYVNQRWLDFTGWPVNVVPGHRWIELIHPDDVDRCGDAYTKAFDQRQPFDVEHRLHRSDGEYRWIVTSGVPRYDKGGSFAGYAGIAVDVTERKLAEETLSTLNQRLIEAHEEERTRLARDLHDDIGQQLIVVLLRLEVVKQRVDVYVPELGVEIGRAIEISRRSRVMCRVCCIVSTLHS